ncbi:hemin uptake protein HemP [Xylophilus rhododendri]|uniref:Hemin uptake protein HemP n=1 Tax=Xylophilus rhododendri TaxID=2697032 RepID=A0A857JDY0_9BURK|nr:hemin uptake protein HemP [Xylophilus rhododendri]QHJ01394.1 hemin uptake protein HemP [Xylophilus rhododendri]
MLDEHDEAEHDIEAAAPSLASILSSELLRGRKAVSISHNGSTYRLQATRLGKLILTK